MSTDPKQEWDALLAANRTAEALAVLEQQARTGNAPACFRLAGLYLIGAVVPRDLPLAREFLRRAVRIGHVDAALLDVALTANGTGGPASWPTARALLDQAARSDPVAAAQRNLLAEMDLTVDGRPVRRRLSMALAKTPRILRFERLFTPAECAHVARTATDLLEPAMIVDPVTGRDAVNPIRTSDAAVIGPAREDLVIRALNHRIAAISGTETDQGEALTVLRYRPGQQYRQHLDTIGQTRNQRVLTVIVYLNDGFTGGETVFAKAGLTIRPRAGDAILFANTTANGMPDPTAQHAGLPVAQGAKWIATRWIRARAFDPWIGPEAA
ncbi:hypothetical protein AWL63_17340 [Sphingomonas panacis]|uniref:Fe2OG dioxygenase domain-containing protein n=1 Tax=Sphingomonas panacis TaxID=1560345 RepID=A0A1B3ZDD3_9SPHN|nr:2OG-Fe(II) oxygenase [Sphingomonas panacis]AOH85441.1 hypothetical protein AWL63_17340 [Sphingomonas panacis]